jgi:hypothetical protein
MLHRENNFICVHETSTSAEMRHPKQCHINAVLAALNTPPILLSAQMLQEYLRCSKNTVFNRIRQSYGMRFIHLFGTVCTWRSPTLGGRGTIGEFHLVPMISSCSLMECSILVPSPCIQT